MSEPTTIYGKDLEYVTAAMLLNYFKETITIKQMEEDREVKDLYALLCNYKSQNPDAEYHPKDKGEQWFIYYYLNILIPMKEEDAPNGHVHPILRDALNVLGHVGR